MSEASTRVTPKGESPAGAEPQIDPELADLPPPPHHSNGAAVPPPLPLRDTPYPPRAPGETMGITESIATAPNPHTTDFSPLPFTTDDSIDVQALDAAAEGDPGSPTARLLRAIAPPNAAQPNPNWAPVSLDPNPLDAATASKVMFRLARAKGARIRHWWHCR